MNPRLSSTRPRVGMASLVVAALAFVAGACSSESDPGEVVLITHESFQMSDELKAAFEEETGLTLTIRLGGDAVEALNQAILTVDNPQGDVFFGVDDATISRAFDAGLFEPHVAAGLDRVPAELQLDPDHRVTPIDHGAVSVN